MNTPHWFVKLTDGAEFSGSCEDGSWRQVKYSLGPRRIEEIYLDNGVGRVNIDKHADAYFIGNKIIRSLSAGSTEAKLVGLGYMKDDTVRIIWARSDTLESVQTEARSIEEAGSFLIINP